MNKADLDTIAERTAQEVAKVLRTGMRLDAIEVCRMAVAWADDENYHGRLVNWNDVVGAARGVLTQVPSDPQPGATDEAIALLRNLQAMFRNGYSLSMWHDYQSKVEAFLSRHEALVTPQPDVCDDEAIALITRMADWLDKSDDLDTIDLGLDAEAYLEKHHARRASSEPDSGPGACQAGNTGGDGGERPARSLDSLE